jgi:UDP-N-acetylmuramate--alanine ligase
MKIKIGIFFGGSSREREVSFAGGRTVYDNLNKSLFEAVPIFVDSFGNFILLEWKYIYKGSIRDFYPTVGAIPESPNGFQIYAESIETVSLSETANLSGNIGRRVDHTELGSLFDFAFLCLHGTTGEDGRIQGLLEYLNIPYSGSGILSSAIGINKVVQKELMAAAGFAGPKFLTVRRAEWLEGKSLAILEDIKSKLEFPCVVKAANQGSSIGLSLVPEKNEAAISAAIDKSFFVFRLTKEAWNLLDKNQRIQFVKTITDIREGVGLPLRLCRPECEEIIYHPEVLLSTLEMNFQGEAIPLILQALDGESEVVIEEFIEGKEFSCIVIEDEQGKAIALPPTEIKKGKELFDYRSKYLPGFARKITPIDLPKTQIDTIRKACESLYKKLYFDVYARIDGFIKADGTVFLNDPNTTSGMMPSSFFFHQAAEIGLNPSQFLTYIIRTSLARRIEDFRNYSHLPQLLERLDQALVQSQAKDSEKLKIAVILGGDSSERHISVESGRNIYEKLASSTKYEPLPVFLTREAGKHHLYQIPVNILLKDNADDIKEKIQHYHVHEVINEIIELCSGITRKYARVANTAAPQQLTYETLAAKVDGVFIALHGRPGEDGEVQSYLEKVGLPYNGSGPASSLVTINKYETNELLMQHGFMAAKHALVYKDNWLADSHQFIHTITENFSFPFIAKPVDDGCSSAVKKIKNSAELEAFAALIFRDAEDLDEVPAGVLNLKLKEEFPQKEVFLVEELIAKNDALHFLEITGGLLTHFNAGGEARFELFEASETLSEGDVLSLEEKFLAGQGQNITPARYALDETARNKISEAVKKELEGAAKILNLEGYARIDAFVRVYDKSKVEVIFIEVNSLPGMTPATCIFHQCAINGYKPYEFIDKILEYGFLKNKINKQ